MSLPEVFQFSVSPPSLSDIITEPEENTYQEELLAVPFFMEEGVFKLELDEPLIEEEQENFESFGWSAPCSEFEDAAQHNYRLWLAGSS